MNNLPCLILAEKVSVQNLTIDKAWNRSMALNGSLAFNEFYNDLEINVSMKRPLNHQLNFCQLFILTFHNAIKLMQLSMLYVRQEN